MVDLDLPIGMFGLFGKVDTLPENERDNVNYDELVDKGTYGS